ncbi:phenylpyruvate tautomerase MIF-related protein [Thiohalocapsa sp. ML1]|jgi:phenylpyruvate tautomerase|uniref:phenylpyruvate tautomerase MIF-related protein n=1 Tax=Thiohalocapsa sp. ML1 TaxID=1431688 RepID=UPI000732404A|nr:phenylpyruvate tautomerase MIF-related protein [Thiohalocapsa sp. ML1]
MPTLIIKTNASLPDDQTALLKAASGAVAELLGKPEGYVMVLLEPVAALCFGGDTAPAAYLELKSLGLPEDCTPNLSAALCGFVEQHLGVPKGRVYIEFAAPPRHLFGWDGRTFG